MKKIITVQVFILLFINMLSFSLIGQIQQLDSDIKAVSTYYDGINNVYVYVNETKREYTYDNDDRLSKEHTFSWSGQWILEAEKEYSYNANNDITKRIDSDWDLNAGQWVYNEKTEYTYNINGDETSRVYFDWDLNTGQWVYSEKTESTYNTNNLLLERTYYIGSILQWMPESKREYAYDTNNNQTARIYYTWDSVNGQWNNSSKTESIFDANNNLLEKTEYTGYISQWTPTIKDEYVFNADDYRISKIHYIWEQSATQWGVKHEWERIYNFNYTSYVSNYYYEGEFSSYGTATLNSNGDPTQFIDYFCYSSGNCRLDSRQEYGYNTNGDLVWYVLYYYDSFGENPAPELKREYTYDPENRRIGESVYNYDNTGFYLVEKYLTTYDYTYLSEDLIFPPNLYFPYKRISFEEFSWFVTPRKWTYYYSDIPNCPTGNITLSTQQEIDDFPLTYFGCAEIPGNIFIGKLSGGSDIKNLDGLSQLTSIQGSLDIYDCDSLTSIVGLANLSSLNSLAIRYNDNLTNLAGLENLNTIPGNMRIEYNDNLTDLTGLNGLTHIENEVFIRYNNALTSLTGLNNLTTTGERIDLRANPALTSLAGLDNLTYVESYIRIWDNDALVDLSGLGSLIYTGGMTIRDNDALTNLNGLNNLIANNGILNIENNSTLQDISTLSSLTAMNGVLIVRNNPMILSLSGLENINYTGITDLKIYENPSLPVCNVASICDYLHNGGISDIYNNATGCDDATTIQNSCSCPTTATLDSLSIIVDQDFYIDGTGFANNPTITFSDSTTVDDAVFSNISLELYFRMEEASCEGDIIIQVTDPIGRVQVLDVFPTCIGGNDLYYANPTVSGVYPKDDIAEWLIEFNDTNDQNTGNEYSIRFARLNYVTASLPVSTLPVMLNVNDQPIPDGLYQADNEVNSTGTVPSAGSVNFKAGQIILLDNGFSVESNADFSAEIEECGGN